jgi:hypothetical protein
MRQSPVRTRRVSSLVARLLVALFIPFTLANAVSAQMQPLDPPDMMGGTEDCNSITLNLCGGGWMGAPSGFMVEWQTRADYLAHGWPAGTSTTSAAPSFCWASFTGGRYALGTYQCTPIQFGQNPFDEAGVTSNAGNVPLVGGTDYVFRTCAYATEHMAASAWSGTLNLHTEYDCHPLDPPDIACGVQACDSITLNLCGGGWMGAPWGFMVQWQKRSDYDQYGWPAGTGTTSSSPSFAWTSFTGGRYALAQYQCIPIQFGNNPFDEPGVASSAPDGPLEIGTDYVFRTYAYGTDSMAISAWSGTLACHTEYACAPAAVNCTATDGYWCAWGPGNREGNAFAWPTSSLALGNRTYTSDELESILLASDDKELVSLAKQLIAAKLNVARGADPSEIVDVLPEADRAIGDLVVPPVGSGGRMRGFDTDAIIQRLLDFNTGQTGPGRCE